jgi:hypothetical protein
VPNSHFIRLTRLEKRGEKSAHLPNNTYMLFVSSSVSLILDIRSPYSWCYGLSSWSMLLPILLPTMSAGQLSTAGLEQKSPTLYESHHNDHALTFLTLIIIPPLGLASNPNSWNTTSPYTVSNSVKLTLASLLGCI